MLTVSQPVVAENAPMLAFEFTKKLDQITADLSGNGRHGTIRGQVDFVEGPAGPAIVLDDDDHIRIKSDSGLDVSDALTIDLWVRREQGGGTLVDRVSDRYRLAVQPDGNAYFGLKTDGSRADLAAGLVPVGKWTRLTAVFERPMMTLYVNGRQVGERKWDHDVGPGGTLTVIGSHAGRDSFFKGAIGPIRVYDFARPPRPEDVELAAAKSKSKKEIRLAMNETDEIVAVDNGTMRVELDKRVGAIRFLSVNGKTLVKDNAAPLVFGTLMESEDYDGTVDFVKRRFIDGENVFKSLDADAGDERFTTVGVGELKFPIDGEARDDVIRYEWRLTCEKGTSRIGLELTLEPNGRFENRFIRMIGIRQPLALNQRKRVVQAGDQGTRWDTRHRYEYHMHVDFAETPERNWWRHFHIDQNTDHSYAIWRAESQGCSGLTAFRGRRAPGWMTLYDEEGGALLAYRGFADRAPKSLYANAEGGGEGVVYLHAPTRPAVDLSDEPMAKAIFGEPHRIDMIFFEGEEALVQPERELAETWGMERLASDGPANFKPVADDGDLWTAPKARGDLTPIVSGAIPLPKGSIKHPDQFRLFDADGNERPAQGRAIAFWPDGSVKWLLLVFPLAAGHGLSSKPGSGDGERTEFKVTLRQGESVPFELIYGGNTRAGNVDDPIKLDQTEDVVSIDTGPLALKLRLGE